MRVRTAVGCIAACLCLIGTIGLTYGLGGGTAEPEQVEVPFGKLVAGSTVGTNATNASVSIIGTLLSTTTDVLYLNNTNATGSSYARIELRTSSGLANLVLLDIGIDNGTQVPQVEVSLGNLTATSGALVELPPASTNTIYVTRGVVVVGPDSSFGLDVLVADTPSELAVVKTRATISVT